MNWVELTWPMVAGACLTLGLIELLIGVGQHPRAPRLLFALSAFAVAAIAGLELALMRADTLAQWWPAMRGLDIAVGVMLVSLTAFIWVYFGTGNKWLARLVPCLYAAGLFFDYLPGGGGMTYDQVTGFRTVETFGGFTFKDAEGTPNPWNVLPYLAVLTVIVFVGDASVRLWRRGERRRAAVVGGAVVFFLMAAGGHSALVETDIVQMPYMISWCYLAILLAMASELNADVLAAAQLSRALKESESRMQLAGAAANLGMWTWDIARDSVWATGRACVLFGLPASEPLCLARLLSASHVEDRDRVEHTIREAIAGNAELDVEHRVTGSDGAERWVALRGQGEKGVRMLGVVIDISERKAAELQAAKDRVALEHMTRVSLLGQLSASIAHQLNQPLAAILGNAEAARKMLERGSVDLVELREICDDIVSEDLRASQVIRRLRDLYRRREPKMEPVNLNQLAGETLDLVRSELLNRQIAVETELAPTLPDIEGDDVQLEQVVLNLLLNAADAMRTTAADERKLTVRTEADATHVRLWVADRGHGIAAGDMKRVFEAFWTTKVGGMGMGLALSESIVAAHHGTIAVANNAGGGATFCVSLPIWRTS